MFLRTPVGLLRAPSRQTCPLAGDSPEMPGVPAPEAVAGGQRAVALATSRRPAQVGLSAPQGTLLSAVSSSRWTASCGLSPWARSRATAPVTWGAAIEVPER